MQVEPTRGGRKLDAAIRHFDLADRVRGASAVDIGASTGGFVAVLLENGAARVTAIDVGHGQLAPELIADPKVIHLERTDFKTLALTVAPGPFDFFSVDVSFVAARSMLRGLAFRLRPGALGVVLVKPQFELPSNLVKGGMVTDPALRERALDTFLAKAARLGFTALGHFDSPVPGGSGSVEILVHLRFEGRPDSMPKPGERKPERAPVAGAEQARRQGGGRAGDRSFLGREHRWFAVAAPGLESPLCAELSALSQVRGARAVDGGVEFAGPVAAGMAANLHSHIATRILLRLGQVKARDFAPLRRALAKLAWAALVPRDRALRVDVSTSHCRLYHTGALAETVELAITDCVGKLPVRDKGADADADADAEQTTRVLVRGQDDVFTVSVDSSGELLHRRGWRLEAGRAPLRETLAAGVLALCEYDPARPLVDLMCGSGTFVVEAASLARRRAPGMGRAFACERWPSHDPEAWAALRATPSEAVPVLGPILAFDRDRRAIEIARANAERANLADAIQFAALPFDKAKVQCEPGLIVMNPPYGHRLGERRHVMQVARKIGDELAGRFRGWRAGILCPDPAFVATLGKGARRPPLASHALRNGGLRVTLAIWSL